MWHRLTYLSSCMWLVDSGWCCVASEFHWFQVAGWLETFSVTKVPTSRPRTLPTGMRSGLEQRKLTSPKRDMNEQLHNINSY
ncbi:hypothetical protein F4779DRAFT_563783 [Xylariaceae sp. FL0662B]|nr:hypothetical protein F4779DRAFT_563783 [Xylariaceae sp. FL0662B]